MCIYSQLPRSISSLLLSEEMHIISISFIYRVYTGHRTMTLRPDASGHLSEIAVEEVSMPADLELLTRQKLKDKNSLDRLELSEMADCTETSIKLMWRAPALK